ncbi:glycerophosphodiester phosphodiesterase family protein [Ewingella americana]|nr:glycerophosphodiester phosphodiesterase family protein [Ewingella americana]
MKKPTYLSLLAMMKTLTHPLIAPENPDVLVIAHRGAWQTTPENSLAALDEAIHLGADIIEIDAQTTADAQLVVIHDAHLDRTCDYQGEVATMPLSMVRRARLKAADGREGMVLTSERVPLLEELLEEARGRIVVNVDIKYPRDLERVVSLILSMNMADGVLLKSKMDITAQRFPLALAGVPKPIPFMPILHARPGLFAADLRNIKQFGAQMIELNFTDLADVTAARDELKRLGVRLWVNTLDVSHSLDFCDSRATQDPEGVWGVLIEAGVRAFQTDNVGQLVRWLKDRGNKRS